jgi:DNA-binding CsgD family transcriptional regulator
MFESIAWAAETPATPHDPVAARRSIARRHLERLATPSATDPREREIAFWRGVVEGRWSLVDRFDADGHRCLIGRANDPDHSERHRLSPRQAAIAALAAEGRSVKYISYELGIAGSTVTSALERALAKLGLTRRAELTAIPKEAFE